MAEATVLAQLVDEAAKALQAGSRGGAAAAADPASAAVPLQQLLRWLRPYMHALDSPKAPRATQKHLGREGAELREQQQRKLLQQTQKQLPKQQQQVQQLLQAYAAASPACVELLQLLDACVERLLRAAADGIRAAQRGLPEGASPAAARAKQQQQQQQQQQSDEIGETAQVGQAAALLTCAVLRESTLDTIPAAASTRARLAAAATVPSRLLSLGRLLLSAPAACGGQQEHAVLQLCLCRLLAAAAACASLGAWRVASAVQGAAAAAAAAAAAEGGDREAQQQHPLSLALAALCEGPSKRLLQQQHRRNGKRADPSSGDCVRPPPPEAQGRFCCCSSCKKSAAGVASAGSRRCWVAAWGPFFVRCCCLSCSGQSHEDVLACSPKGVLQQAVLADAAAASASPAAAATAAAAAAAGRIEEAVRQLRERQGEAGIGGCGLVPVRYALRQETLRLLLLLLLHPDPLVRDALLRSRRHQQQQQQQVQGGSSKKMSAAAGSSSRRSADGVTVLRVAFEGLRTDRELDALCFMVGLLRALDAAKGGGSQSGETETAAWRLLLSRSSEGAFDVPCLLQTFTAREDLQHLLHPLLYPAAAAAAAAAPAAAAAVVGADGFFSSAWLLQRLLAQLLLLAVRPASGRYSAGAGVLLEEIEAAREASSGAAAASPLVSLALELRPLHLPPQQELLLLLLAAKPALLPHVCGGLKGLLFNPRPSSTFALSCLALSRLLEASCNSSTKKQQQEGGGAHPLHAEVAAAAVKPSALAAAPWRRQHMSASSAILHGDAETEGGQQQQQHEQEQGQQRLLLFKDLEGLRLQHAQQHRQQQETQQRRERMVSLAAACVVPPGLLLRQHLTQCLLQGDSRLLFLGLSVLRGCCLAARRMDEVLAFDPQLQLLFTAQVAARLPDAKTLVNALLLLIQRQQQQQQQGGKVAFELLGERATPQQFWVSDEALARAAAASAAAAVKQQLQQQQELAAAGDEEVEVYVDGLEELAVSDAVPLDEAETGEPARAAAAATAAETKATTMGTGASVSQLMCLLTRATSLHGSLSRGAPHLCGLKQEAAEGASEEEETLSHSDVSEALLLSWIDTAEVYQELLTASSFPLDFGKLLCTWRPGGREAQGPLLCCRWTRVAAGFTRLGLNAHSSSSRRQAAEGTGRLLLPSTSDPLARGAPVTKQQHLLLLHLLLQWQRGSAQRADGGHTERAVARAESAGAAEEALKTLLSLEASGLFKADPLNESSNSGLGEAAVWLSTLRASGCFRCCAIYFVGLLRLAWERRVSLLPLLGDSRAQPSGVSLFAAALVSHLSLSPSCNNGRGLQVDLPLLGIQAPRDSCWGCCSPLHAPAFCSEAVTQWVVRSLMCCCLLRPTAVSPLLRCISIEGPWRVLKAAASRGSANAGGEQSPAATAAAAAAAAAAVAADEGLNEAQKTVNRLRKKLLRFLELSCSELPANAETTKDAEEVQLRLPAQLKSLALLSPQPAAAAAAAAAAFEDGDSGDHSAHGAVSLQPFLQVCAASLSDTAARASSSSSLIAAAEGLNGLAAVDALTRHLQQVLETETHVETSACGLQDDVARISGIVLQLEATSRLLLPSARAAGLLHHQTPVAVASAQEAFRLSTAKPVLRLLKLAARRLDALAAGETKETIAGSIPAARLEPRRSEAACLMRWVKTGAALCKHAANLLEAFVSGGRQGSSCVQQHSHQSPAAAAAAAPAAVKPLLQRLLGFLAAFVKAEAALNARGHAAAHAAPHAAADKWECLMRQLGLDAHDRFLGMTTVTKSARETGCSLQQRQQQNDERHEQHQQRAQQQQREETSSRTLVLQLLKRIDSAASCVLGVDSRRLLLLCCDRLVGCGSSSNPAGAAAAAAAAAPAAAAAQLVHSKWVLLLLDLWGLACGGLAPAEAALTLQLLLRACGCLGSGDTWGLAEAAVCMQQLQQGLTASEALQLLEVVDCLEAHLSPIPYAEQQQAEADSSSTGGADASTNQALKAAAARLMCCLSFECHGAPKQSDTNAQQQQQQQRVLVFRSGLTEAFRALWQRRASLRAACMRLFSQENEGADAVCSVTVHVAARLALLLQWRGPVDSGLLSFYPALKDGLQQCEHQVFSEAGEAAACSNKSGRRRSQHSKQQGKGEVVERPGCGFWASDLLEALKVSVFSGDRSSGPRGKRMRSKALPWRQAEAFFGAACRETAEDEEETNTAWRWAEASRGFLIHLCNLSRTSPAPTIRLALELARSLEAAACSMEEPFLIANGWPVDGWARFLAFVVGLHAAKSSRDDAGASAAVAFVVANYTGVGLMLRDLKTELRELQEALPQQQQQKQQQQQEQQEQEEEDGAVEAAGDLVYFLETVDRASQLGTVLLEALQVGLRAEAGIGRPQRQFFKSLTPKAQAVACGFFEALATSPPFACVARGAACLKIGGQQGIDSSPQAVQAWVGLLVPALRLALHAAALESTPAQAQRLVARLSRQLLTSPALAALGKAAKGAALHAVSGGVSMGIGSSEAAAAAAAEAAAELKAALLPLLQCLCDEVLPSLNAAAYSSTGKDQQQQQQQEGGDSSGTASLTASHCISAASPDLFEAFVALYGASTSSVDAYLCCILILDSLCRSSTQRGLKHGPASGSGDRVDSSCEVFSPEWLWMTRLPDFGEVAETLCHTETGESTMQQQQQQQEPRVRLKLEGPCDWLTLDPRRLKQTLNDFGFAAAAAGAPAAAAARGVDDRLSVMCRLQQRLLVKALKARCLLDEVGGIEENDAMETVRDRELLLRSRLRGLQSATLWCTDSLERETALSSSSSSSSSSRYDMSYLAPYLAGRLTAACLVLLLRWQRTLEAEQQQQQQQRAQREAAEAAADASGASPAAAAPAAQRPVCVAEQTRRACGVAGSWLRFIEGSSSGTVNKASGDRAAPALDAAELPEETKEKLDAEDAEGAPEAAAAAAAAEDSVCRKRRIADVWEMDGFDPEEVRPAVERLSSFLKAARSTVHLARRAMAAAAAAHGGGEAELLQRLEAWGAPLDDEDQWLSSFAAGGGLQLLIMSLGCEDWRTREAASRGLAVYMHLLQLSADRSLLFRFAAVHEQNMNARKRLKRREGRPISKQETQQNHKAPEFAFKEVRQILSLLAALRASIQHRQEGMDAGEAAGVSPQKRALSPVVCSFAASTVPLLLLSDHELYPLLNFSILKHAALSLLLHDPCLPFTLAASRQPLLGSEGIVSRLLLSPSAATAEQQRGFLLLVLQRALRASRCIGSCGASGFLPFNLRQQTHAASAAPAGAATAAAAAAVPHALLPTPANLALSLLPQLTVHARTGAVDLRVLECLCISTAAPTCLSGCSWWRPHDTFKLLAKRAASPLLAALGRPFWGPLGGPPPSMQQGAPGLLPLATVNARHLLQRFDVLLWINAQLEALLLSLNKYRSGGTKRQAARERESFAAVLRCPVPMPILRRAAADCSKSSSSSSGGQNSDACSLESSPCCSRGPSSGLGAAGAARLLPMMRGLTRLLWSLVTAATLTPPLSEAAAAYAACCSSSNSSSSDKSSGSSSSNGNSSRGREGLLPEASCLLSPSLLSLTLKARRQLFSLRLHREVEETIPTSQQASRALGLHAEAAYQLHLSLLRAVQTLARAWFAVAAFSCQAINLRHDGCAVAPLRMHDACSPNLAADLQQASSACASTLLAVITCSEALGLLRGHSTGRGGDRESLFWQQHQLHASACAADVFRLCGWAVAVNRELQDAHAAPNNGGACESRSKQSAFFYSPQVRLSSMAFAALCMDGAAATESCCGCFGALSACGGACMQRRRHQALLHALLRLQATCGGDGFLRELCAAAAELQPN
ncbi:hypothetical protein Esti_005346 [Eimeria stiedai]